MNDEQETSEKVQQIPISSWVISFKKSNILIC